MNTMSKPEERLLEEWPRVLDALKGLSELEWDDIVRTQHARPVESDHEQPAGVQRPLSDEVLALLGDDADKPSIEGISKFLASLWSFERRFYGTFDKEAEDYYRYAVYSLVYLVKTEPIISMLLLVFVPLLRSGLWDTAFRYKLQKTFRDTIDHVFEDIEGIEEAGDHQPFDWFGNLNELEDWKREGALEFAGVPFLEHPGFPPQEIWYLHTNVQMIPTSEYEQVLVQLYDELGHDWRWGEHPG